MQRVRDKILGEMLRQDAWDFVPRRFHRGPFDKPVTKQYGISICTTCMNRTNDLKKTYEKNIVDNQEYPHVEFVLLNYNSYADDMGEWVRETLGKYIKKGILNYYYTKEPEYYSMTHSRNIAFKVAQGHIVNNVDADHFTNEGFAAYVNMLANHQLKKAIFLKSKQKNRGRLGFYRKDFLWLGGYNEEIEGYGHDDNDLLNRALCAGFTAMFYGGQFFTKTDDHRRHPTDNYENKDWKYTERKNTLISLLNLKYGRYRTNQNKHWGKATLIKNFKEEIKI